MTFEFTSNKDNWSKSLGAVEYFSSPVFTRGGFYFKGAINEERFLVAIKEAFNEFHFLLATFFRDGDGWRACYPPKNQDDKIEQLEIERREEERIDSATLDVILPDKIVDERMRLGFSVDLEGILMGFFKLTIFMDGFVIGYNVNHSLFDQASIFYFLKYTSHLYTYGKEKLSLKQPIIVDVESFETKNQVSFKDINEVREYGNSILGFTYSPPSKTENIASNSDNVIIKLKFNLMEIEEFKKTPKQYISTNDIIHAILFKIYTFNPNLQETDEFCLRYAVNARKHLGLGEEAIGNLVHQCRIILTVGELRKKTLLELALVDRQSISEISGQDFLNDVGWYKYIKDNKVNTMEYIGKGSSLTTRTTNWTNFDYNNVTFDGSLPIAVKSPSIASYGVNVISFDTQDNQKIFTCPISIPSNCLDYAVELGKSSKLYIIEHL